MGSLLSPQSHDDVRETVLEELVAVKQDKPQCLEYTLYLWRCLICVAIRYLREVKITEPSSP